MSLSNIPSLEAHIREPAMNGLEFFFVGFDQALPLGKKKKKKSKQKVPDTIGTIYKSRMVSMHEGRKLSDFILAFLPDRGNNMNEENRNSCFSVFVLQKVIIIILHLSSIHKFHQAQ